MSNELKGSNLARTMLARGDKQIWCAIGDENDQETMAGHDGNDFTAYIVAFNEGYFYCTGGMPWLSAVPVKLIMIVE